MITCCMSLSDLSWCYNRGCLEISWEQQLEIIYLYENVMSNVYCNRQSMKCRAKVDILWDRSCASEGLPRPP